jgi:hypothetical protein
LNPIRDQRLEGIHPVIGEDGLVRDQRSKTNQAIKERVPDLRQRLEPSQTLSNSGVLR